MVNNKISKTIYTDVLVIGGGGAGVWAAVEAVRAGAKVTVVSKGNVGNSGNTIMIGGSYSMDGDSAKNIYGWEGGDIELTRDFLLEQIIKQSFFLAEQDVAEQYVEDSPAVVYETYEWCKRAGQNQVFMPPGGWLVSGRGLGRGLLQGLKENPGAELIEDVMVLDLLTKNGNVIGALGVDVYTGEFIRFSAKAVIMATGGYQPFTIKNTNSDMTGDGMAMAYRAGADLADMEFHLFVPTAVEPEEFKGSLMPFIYEVFAGKSIPAIDEEGNPIVISKEMAEVAEGSELEKLVSTYYWSEAISEGRGFAGDTMYYDFSHMPDEVIKRGFEKMIDAMSQFYKPGYYHGDNIGVYRDFILANKKLKVGLIDEYTMGGIVITKDMETSLQGLFAAGEVGSGVFGACRIADATTEMMVQGSKAGKVAGAYIKNVDLVEPDESQIEEIIKNVTAPLGRNGGLCGAEIIHAIEKAADEGFGICRDEKGLSRALQELEHIEKDLLPNISVPCSSMRYNYDWIRSIQAKNLLTCTIAGVKAALLRKESRGFHMRHDYKKVNNDEWAVRIIIHKKEKEMELFTRKAKITKYEIPAGKETSIPAYIKNQDLNFKNVNFKE